MSWRWENFIILPTFIIVHPSSTKARKCSWAKKSSSYPRCRAKIWWIHFYESEEIKRNSWVDSQSLFTSWRSSVQKLLTTFVRPHLEYGRPVWAPHLKKYITILENVLRRATKLVDGFHRMSYSERLKKLNLPSLVYRRARGDVMEKFQTFPLLQQLYATWKFQTSKPS